MDTLLTISYIANFITCLVSGAFILLIKTAPYLKDKLYNQARYCLGIAAIIVALSNLLAFLPGDKEFVDILSFPVLFVSSIQACLFTFLVLILFHSSCVTRQTIIKHLLPTALFTIAYLSLIRFIPDKKSFTHSDFFRDIGNPVIMLRIAFTLTYALQIMIYIRLFRRERAVFINKMNDYFSDIDKLKLRWCTQLFSQAVTIGITVLLFILYPAILIDIMLTFMIAIFYFCFVMRYINYQYTLFETLPAMNEIYHEKKVLPLAHPTFISIGELITKWQKQPDKPYLSPGITIEEVALAMKCDKRDLSKYINTELNSNFNSWINQLRIEEVEWLISNRQDFSLTDISEKTGFADLPMMSRYFKKFNHISPSEYRKQFINNPRGPNSNNSPIETTPSR